MDVSIIMAASRSDIARCLESLARQVGDIKFEIIVVGERGMGRPVGVDKWIEVGTANPAVKRNAGAAVAQGGFLAFIDDDAWAPTDWLKTICEILDADPTLAGVGGPNLLPDDADDAERLTDAVLSTKLGSGAGSYSTSGVDHDAGIGEIHLVNFAVRRDFFRLMGGFNEALGYGAEDSEFIYLAGRMQLARFLYTPRLTVWHRRRAWGSDLLSRQYRLRSQNGRLLWMRPGMYLNNAMFASAFLAPLIFLPLALIVPAVIPIAIIIYLMALGVVSRRVAYQNKIRWIYATAAVHVISVLGILVGFLNVPSRGDYAGLTRRPAL